MTVKDGTSVTEMQTPISSDDRGLGKVDSESGRGSSRRWFAAVIAPVVAAGALAFPAISLAGNYEYWGYRTNSFQTWALATQSPEYSRSVIPHFGVAAYVMGTSWRWNAQGARSIGRCTGITWSATPIYVGCSRR